MTIILGIDVGGSAIKGALVETDEGCLVSERQRIAIDRLITPQETTLVIKKIVASFDAYPGPFGVGFPAPIKRNIARMAANIHNDWIGMDVAEAFRNGTGRNCFVLNDADAAGLAEVRYGAGREFPKGVILMVTLGTGIGSAIFVDGKLLPNSEFGHLKIRGKDAEMRASDAVRRNEELSWKKWAKRLQEYFDEMETLISPDFIIIGGGVSKKSEKFLPYLNLKAQVLPALLLNEAGIIGAASFAAEELLQENI